MDILLIGSDRLGGRDDQLGAILLSNFLRILSDQHESPEYIVMWNSAVKEAATSSENLSHLQKLEGRGVKIVICRTCVEYFGIENELGVGIIDGMANIQKLLFSHSVLTI